MPPTTEPITTCRRPAGRRGDCRRRQATADVLHVINGEHYAGAERVQDLLAKRLPEFGFRADSPA